MTKNKLQVITKKPTGIKLRSPQEVYAQQLKTNEAYMIIVQMNKDGKTLSEISHYLNENGYVTKQLTAWNTEAVRHYLRYKGMRPNVKKQQPPKDKSNDVPKHKDAPALECRLGRERPHILKIALGVLMGRFKWDDNGYSLRRDGKWHIASLCDVMRETNKELKKQGLPQITLNQNWVIK